MMNKDNGARGNGGGVGSAETKRSNAEILGMEIKSLKEAHIVDGKIDHAGFKEHLEDIENMLQKMDLFKDDKDIFVEDLEQACDEIKEMEHKQYIVPKVETKIIYDEAPKSIRVYDVGSSDNHDTGLIELKRQNGQKIIEAIQQLSEDYVNDIKQDYQGFWLQCKNVVAMFESLKMFMNDRNMAWSAYNQLCDKVRARQNERNQLKVTASKRKRQVIEDIIKEVESNIGGIFIDEEKFGTLKKRLEQGLDLMKKAENFDYDKIVTDFSDDLDSWKRIKMFRDDADICWNKWMIVRNKLNLSVKQDDGVNLEYCNKVQDIINMIGVSNPSDVLDAIKNVQAEMRQREDMFIGIKKDLRRSLEDLWSMTAGSSSGIDKSSNVEAEIADRMKKKSERLESLLQKNKQAIIRINAQLKDCHDRIAKTQEPEMIDKIKGWIDEKQGKIDDITRADKDIEREMAEIVEKLKDK